MISVRSLLPRLSGSRVSLINCLCLATCLCGQMSCAVFNDAAKGSERVVIQPSTKNNMEDGAEPNEEVPSKESTEEETTEKIVHKSFFAPDRSLNLLLLAPFDDSRQQDRFIEFYAGFKSAASRFESQDDLIIEVQNLNSDTISNHLARKISQADIVVGPYYPDDIASATQYLNAALPQLFISPWLGNQYIPQNVHYVQLSASRESHLKKMLHHAMDQYSLEEILLLTKKGEQDLIIQSESIASKYIGDSARFMHYGVEDVNKRSIIHELAQMVRENNIRAIVIPHWKDRSFLMTLLGRLNVVRGEEPLRIYCMQQVLSSTIDYSTLESMDVLITSTKRDEFLTEAGVQFKKQYYETYSSSPSRSAYLGHDVMMLVHELSQMLQDNEYIDEFYQCKNCFNSFTLRNKGGAFDSDSLLQVENIEVDLLEFSDYEFKVIEY